MLSKTAALALGLALVLGACGEDDGAGAPIEDPAPAPDADTEDTTPEQEADEAAPDQEPADVIVTTAESPEHGTIVVDGDGFVLYVFDNDAGGESRCYDECAAAWPPLLGESVAANGLDASLLGTTQRTDDSVQVTFAGNPLYYFSGDRAPGDASGHGLNGVWWVVAPDGQKVTGDGGGQSAGGGQNADDDYGY